LEQKKPQHIPKLQATFHRAELQFADSPQSQSGTVCLLRL